MFFYLKLFFYFFIFLDYFDILILKIIFKKLKNIILIHFRIKKTLKNYYYYIFKHPVNHAG
jgi:hypothetical protein